MTAASTGGAIMIVEILGAKMLAPYFGTSHFVWTAQIAVTLVSLAAGYYVGGRLVDRSQDLKRMYTLILAAAVYLGLSALIVEPVSYACLKFELAAGSLLASAFLFFVPLFLLAMVGPFFVRVLTASVGEVGGTVGRLTAVSTAGSFLGTLLIGYVLIPHFRNSVTMIITAGLLMLLSLSYTLIWRPRLASIGLVVLLMTVGLGLGAQGVREDRFKGHSGWTEIHRVNSNFGRLQVVQSQDGSRRYYLNDFLTQNTYEPATRLSTSMFTYALHDLAVAHTEQIKDVLCIGLGIGIVPMRFATEGAQVDVAEINPAAPAVARDFFDCDLSKMNVHVDDARHFLNETKRTYDAVILDAFLGDSSPSHLMTKEAFAAIRRVLKPGGVLVINSFCDFNRGRDFMASSLDMTLKSVFRSVGIRGAGNGNVFFVATDQPELAVRRRPDLNGIHAYARDQVASAIDSELRANPDHGIVLTDDYNPVEFRDAANREQIRRYLVMAFQ